MTALTPIIWILIFASLAAAGMGLSILADFIAPILIGAVVFTMLVVASAWGRR